MKNVPLPRNDYMFFRQWLRSTDITWRDITDSVIIPRWGEAVCNQDDIYDGKTSGEIAYDTLTKHYPNLKLQWRKSELALLDMRPPKFFKGEYQGEIFALDIARAYNQLYRKLSLYGEWPTKRAKYSLRGLADELAGLKRARNAVVGICRSTRNKWVQGTKVWYVPKINKYLSPILWGHIQSILNQAAVLAMGFGAIHINTDGYCFKSQNDRDSFKDALSQYGIETKAYQGEGRILGISSVNIFNVKTPLQEAKSKPVHRIEPQERDWLAWWHNKTIGD